MLQVGSVDVRVSWKYPREDQEAGINDKIHYEYNITNNGLLTLYNVALYTEDGDAAVVCEDTDGSASDTGAGSVGGLASYVGDHGLAPAGVLTCQATGGVSRAEVSPRATKELPGRSAVYRLARR